MHDLREDIVELFEGMQVSTPLLDGLRLDRPVRDIRGDAADRWLRAYDRQQRKASPAYKAKRREWQQKWLANLTPEALDRLRAQKRERNRRWRERMKAA